MRKRDFSPSRSSPPEKSSTRVQEEEKTSYTTKQKSLYLLVLVTCLGGWWVWQSCRHTTPPDSPSQLPWWKTTVVYQIYPRSFQDSDGDGVGDIKGIIRRLDYIRSLNVRAIWLNPIFRSPMRDFGYDVSNYTDIDPTFGNIEDFKKLISTAHEKGIRVILDFVPNHSSDQHPWFQLSRKGVAPYKDFYIWTKRDTPPNNWKSLFRGPAWTRDSERDELYYHAFLPQQPDLNWRCPQLVLAMKDVLRFWLRLGVDGFRVDAVQNLYEVEDLSLDEPASGLHGVDQDSWFSLRHDYTFDSPDIGGAVQGWREVLDEFEVKDGVPRFLVVETLFDPNVSIRNEYYEYGADMPFNFDLLRLNRSCGAYCIQHYVDRELNHIRSGQWPNFVVGNHDNPRIATKMGAGFVNAVNMLLLTLPGTPTSYYGEELGMADVPVTFVLGQDIQAKRHGEDYFLKHSRDPSRTPMQWNEGHLAGFTSGTRSWLPMSDNANIENVEKQSRNSQSSLELYRKLAALRDLEDFQEGQFQYAVINKDVFSYVRSYKSNEGYLISINFGENKSSDDFSHVSRDKTKAKVVLTTDIRVDYVVGTEVDLKEITLYPGQGLIVKLSGQI